jgi:hypothetical protein
MPLRAASQLQPGCAQLLCCSAAAVLSCDNLQTALCAVQVRPCRLLMLRDQNIWQA